MSTYTTNKNIEMPASGSYNNAWAAPVNADWADIDGPLLIARDPFAGVTYDRGKIQLPELPGLGVRESVVA